MPLVPMPRLWSSAVISTQTSTLHLLVTKCVSISLWRPSHNKQIASSCVAGRARPLARRFPGTVFAACLGADTCHYSYKGKHMNKSDIPAPQKAALGMLIDDHRKVASLVKDYESAQDQVKQKKIIEHIGMELLAHTEIEEQLFYLWLRDKDAQTFGDMVDEAIVEHASIKDIVHD